MAEKRTKNRSPTAKDLEKALEVMRSLGFKIESPSTELEIERQSDSVKKLGFSKVQAKKEEKESKELLKYTLGTSHIVGGVCYGPGEIVLTKKEASLYRSLIYQDNLSKQAHYDRTDYQPVSKCFIVEQGKSQDAVNRFSKRAVSEAAFAS